MKIFSYMLIIGLTLLALPVIAQDGQALFSKKCAMCHGADGKKVAGVKFSEEGVRKGKAPRMPSYEGKLTPEEIKAVIEYAQGLK